jgi:hypothetical protein
MKEARFRGLLVFLHREPNAYALPTNSFNTNGRIPPLL